MFVYHLSDGITDNRFENLTNDEYTTFLSLKSNNNIMIQKADKGNTVVILDRVS